MIVLGRKIKYAAVFSAVSLAAGALSAYISGSISEEYATLMLPSFAPPAAVFPIVWTLLYILVGIGAGLVCAGFSPFRERALISYALQVATNFVWPIIFFGAGKYFAAFFWLLFLLWSVCFMTLQFAKANKTAALLQLPYIVWLVYAAVLNLFAALMN